MANLAQWILADADGEVIEGVVIGEHYLNVALCPEADPFNAAPIGKLISWEEALPFLTYEFDTEYGSTGCHPIFAWTATKVIFITEGTDPYYSDAINSSWVPRNPGDCKPDFGGVDEL